MATCSLAQWAAASVTIVTGIAAAVVLVLRELRWSHPTPTDPPAGHDVDG